MAIEVPVVRLGDDGSASLLRAFEAKAGGDRPTGALSVWSFTHGLRLHTICLIRQGATICRRWRRLRDLGHLHGVVWTVLADYGEAAWSKSEGNTEGNGRQRIC